MYAKKGIIESIRMSITILLIATAIDLVVRTGDIYFLYINHLIFTGQKLPALLLSIIKNEAAVFLIKFLLLVIMNVTFLGKLVITRYKKDRGQKQIPFFVITWAALILLEIWAVLFTFAFGSGHSAMELLPFIIVIGLYIIVGLLTLKLFDKKLKNQIQKTLAKN